MKETVTYFAYGSNLLFARLHARCPSIVKLGVGRLEGHRLNFNKPGGDGSGKCGIEEVDTGETVLGVLYQMKAEERLILDEIEGLGHGYVNKEVVVIVGDEEMSCFTYYPTNSSESSPPYDWYKAFVLEGAKENGLPNSYIKLIENIVSKIDTNAKRSNENKKYCRK